MGRLWIATRMGQRGGEQGSQLLEFAIAAPMLLLLVIGIWDYGAAFALKQKLTNAAREGARIVSDMPSNTVDASSGASCSPAPCNIQSGASAVAQYMNQAGLNASCVFTTTPAAAKTGNGWVYSCNGLTLEIDRGSVSPTAIEPYTTVTTTSGSSLVALTVVSVTYPVTWTAGQLVPPPLPPQVTTQVRMQNLK